jgi:hypothetical protein
MDFRFVHRAACGVKARLDLLVEREVNSPPDPVERRGAGSRKPRRYARDQRVGRVALRLPVVIVEQDRRRVQPEIERNLRRRFVADAPRDLGSDVGDSRMRGLRNRSAIRNADQTRIAS